MILFPIILIFAYNIFIYNMERKYVCIDCGKEFIVESRRDTHAKRCPICRKLYRKSYDSTNKVCNSSIGLLCGKHYLQYKRYGKIQNRTKSDSNEIVLKEDYAIIILYNNKSEPIAETLIDIEDIDKIKNSKWCKDKNNYVKNSNQEYLHRIIMEESNLRICCNADNLKNRVKLPSNNTSGILGVRYREDRNKWYAEIQYNKQKINLGSYTEKDDAIKARLEAEIKYFGIYKSKILNV